MPREKDCVRCLYSQCAISVFLAQYITATGHIKVMHVLKTLSVVRHYTRVFRTTDDVKPVSRGEFWPRTKWTHVRSSKYDLCGFKNTRSMKSLLVN